MVARPASGPAGAPAIDRMRRLAKAALVVLTGFLLSRLLGLVRNMVIAAHFGTGTDYAAYVSALALPDLVFQVLVGAAVRSAFIPVFKRYLTQNKDPHACPLPTSVLNLFLLISLV